MPTDDFAIEPLDLTRLEADLPDLLALLDDAVTDGASVGFVAPFDRTLAAGYWRGQIEQMAHGRRHILVARRGERIVGSVQLSLASQQNGRHRAEVERLLVLRSAQRRGIGNALMLSVESLARSLGRTLLMLNTRSGDPPEFFYDRFGYIRIGIVPKFAQNPDGTWNTTTLFYKHLK